MPTERVYRQSLGRSLDDIGVYTVLTHISNTLTLNHWATALANASNRRYDARWIFVDSASSAGVQKIIRSGSYTPSAGSVLPLSDSGWETTLQVNDEVEITGLFPSAPCDLPGGEDDDYRTLLNRGLGRLLIEDFLDVTTVADQYTYSLSTYAAWLDRPTRFLGVLDPPRATGLPRRESWRRARLKVDGATPTLEFIDRPYSTSGATFQLAVLRPANTLISGAESTAGLSGPLDTAVPSVEEVVTAARVFAFEALMTRSKGRPSGDWGSQYEMALEQARGLARWDRSQDAAPAPAAQGVA